MALAIDLRGHGSSASESLPDARAFSARLADSLRDAEEDVRSALHLLAREPGVDARRIGIVGAGIGAVLAARAALFPPPAPRPAALVLLSPWGRPDVYREALASLPPESVLLLAGTGEEAGLATARALLPPAGSAGPRLEQMDAPTAQFETVEAHPGTLASIGEFLRARLASPPARTGGRSR